MKELLRRHIVILASIIVAVLAIGGAAAAAKGSHSQAVVLLQSERSPQAAETPEAQKAEQPEHQQELQEPDEDEDVEEQEEDEAVHENLVQPTPAPPPTVTTRTFALVGGTATFSCTGNAIALVSAVPNAGFGVETEREDGGTEIKVRFENDAHRSEIRAGCAGGQVVAEEIREENG